MNNVDRRNIAARRSGWVTFAGCMMILVGSFQAVAGLVAIFDSRLYVVGANNLWVLDYRQWGWVHLILGLIIALSSVSLFAGRLWGRIVAITLATLSAIANFGFIWAYPFWSIMMIIIDVFIIYGVAMHGGNTDYE